MAIGLSSLDKTASNMTSSVISQTETETKNILNQITSKQQNLKRLSSDSKMSAEEKAKERQEIQKQIAELNRKLRMLRMEKEEEVKEAEKEQEQKAVLSEERNKALKQEDANKVIMTEDTQKQKEKVNVSPQNIQKMLEGSSLVQKERIQQRVDNQKELAGNILETEIKLDELYGADTSAKKEELADMIKANPFELRIEEPQEQNVIFGEKAPVKIIIREDGI